MNAASKKRVVLAGLAAVLILLAALFLWRMRSSQGTLVGDYRVPAIASWDVKGKTSKNVRIKGSVANHNAVFYFRCVPRGVSVATPVTTQEIVARMRDDDQSFVRLLSGLKKVKNQFQTLNVQETIYKGMPAVESQTISQTIFRGKNETSFSRRLHFDDGFNKCRLAFPISFKEKREGLPPDAQAEADRVWQKMTEGLRHR